MNPQLHNEILPLLMQDYLFRDRGEFLRAGVCPSCQKKELYTNREHPWVLRCGRLNKCGAEFHIKDLYPELFDSWSDRHKPTPDNPNASADAYLRDGRGFSLEKIKGWYSQEQYFDYETKEGSATVRFRLSNEVLWERIIDRPYRFGKRKATIRGEYKGMWWEPPTGTGIPEELWITEGIFDAIALQHHGIVAVAALSCGNYPNKALEALAKQCDSANKPRPCLVWALDGDKAGRSFAKKHCLRARDNGWNSITAIIPQDSKGKLDWNDMHQRDRLKPHHIEEYRYQGDLMMAESATEKAILMYQRTGYSTFPFEFDNRLFWWKLDLEKLTREQNDLDKSGEYSDEEVRDESILKSNTVTEICNCLPTPLYFLKNEVTDEAWYYFRVDFPHDGDSVKNTFTAGQLTAVSEFKKRLLHSGAGAIWTGNGQQLDRLLSRWTFNIKTVETVDFIGYSIAPNHQAYVFNSVAVKDGRIVELNDEDYFELGKLAIKSLSRSLKLDLNTDLKAYDTSWFEKLYLCFGPKGIIALAYWMGSLFAEQIRQRFESFPFIEIVGEPGAGKTTLLETLWKLLGRQSYEGFDPMKGSQVGFLRSMAQVSNLPVVLIESDREEDSDGKGRPKQAFHWDSLKSLYNGGSLRTTGVKSSGNDTYEPQFRAALVISQNAPVQASSPIMERIIHVGFDKSRQSDAGREAALELGRMSAKQVSGFMLKAITQEKKVLEMIEQHQRAFEKRMEETGVRNQRIQKNYAQLMVLINALALVCPITETQRNEAIKLLAGLALEREQSLAKDHPMVEQFWEAYEYLNGTSEDDEFEYKPNLDHSRDRSIIAINLNHFIQVATEMRQQIPHITDLKRLLKTSRQRKFIGIKTVNSGINGRYNALQTNANFHRPSTLKCWCFEAPKR